MIGGRIRGWLARVRTSRIGLRVLAFNLLVLFLPVAGILYLDVYEARLLDTQERGMIQAARILSAALAERGDIAAADADALLGRIARDADARIRVYDRTGALLSDSARLAGKPPAASAAEYVESDPGVRRRILYRVGAWLAQARRGVTSIIGRALHPRSDSFPTGSNEQIVPPEIRAARQGRYGAATRVTPGQRSLTLHSAVPIWSAGAVVGVVQVSQSTFRVLQALYAVRLRIFEVVITSMLAAAALSILMSSTLVRPLARLRRAALAFADGRVIDSGSFRRVDRQDEIGDLARALDSLMQRLESHIRLLESFSADVSHEFKNPLASIRTAAETIAATDDGDERARFLAMLIRDVDRLERLVSGVRELAQIDGQLAHERPARVDLAALLSDLVEGMRLAHAGGAELILRVDTKPLVAYGTAERLTQVFENVLENARSLAPAATAVEITAGVKDGWCRVAISDRGPGIPPGHLERVFERFFTYRPGNGKGRREHTGLGLSIARAIVEGYGGTITAANRPDGGACFEVCLPAK